MGKKISMICKVALCVFLFVFTLSHFALELEAGTKLDEIKKAGKLVVGTSADYPPYEFHLLNDKDGDLVGIDIDIANAIGKELGVKVVIQDMIFSRIFDSLNKGEIDLGIAGLSPTEERRKKALFSEIYYQAIQSIIIRKKDVGKVNVIEDLRGKKVGIQKDSIQEDMAKAQINGSEFIIRDTIEELIIILKKGVVDAVILEQPVAESYVKRHSKAFAIVNCKQTDKVLGSAIAVKKTDKDLLEKVNQILKKLKDENKINEFAESAKILTIKK